MIKSRSASVSASQLLQTFFASLEAIEWLSMLWRSLLALVCGFSITVHIVKINKMQFCILKHFLQLLSCLVSGLNKRVFLTAPKKWLHNLYNQAKRTYSQICMIQVHVRGTGRPKLFANPLMVHVIYCKLSERKESRFVTFQSQNSSASWVYPSFTTKRKLFKENIF